MQDSLQDSLQDLYDEVVLLGNKVIQLQVEGFLPPLETSKIVDGHLFVPQLPDSPLWIVYGPEGAAFADGPEVALIHPRTPYTERAGGFYLSQLENMKHVLLTRIALASS